MEKFRAWLDLIAIELFCEEEMKQELGIKIRLYKAKKILGKEK